MDCGQRREGKLEKKGSKNENENKNQKKKKETGKNERGRKEIIFLLSSQEPIFPTGVERENQKINVRKSVHTLSKWVKHTRLTSPPHTLFSLPSSTCTGFPKSRRPFLYRCRFLRFFLLSHDVSDSFPLVARIQENHFLSVVPFFQTFSPFSISNGKATQVNK
mmetsp:Transcript_25675/g.64552  ORF Transcript_25675/g.64552 Transcript_25675/m.64552 type:complete len:163 (+) Transcript_25675:180-668(+)